MLSLCRRWVGRGPRLDWLFDPRRRREARTMRRTRRALGRLIDQAPSTALIIRDGEQREVPARYVEPGETVVVRPGPTSRWTARS